MPTSTVKPVGPFRLAKAGQAAEECEDAADLDLERGRFAIADGSSESAFAALWAGLLVRAFVAAPASADRWASWLAPVQQRWAAEVSVKPLSWYTEKKVEQGDFAAFLGLSLERSAAWPGELCWRACAVGDSCLFQVRQGRLRAFPLTRSDQFGNSPGLVGSRGLPGALPERQGCCCEGDQMWLMTDALAQWFLRQTEAGREPWEDIGHRRTGPAADADFRTWVEDLRDRDGLRNDDVTLILIDL